MTRYDREWFERHQGAMLMLANCRAGRRALRIDGDVPTNRRIVRIEPHSFTYLNEGVIPAWRKARRGEPITLTTDFRTAPKIWNRLVCLEPKFAVWGDYLNRLWVPFGVRPAWADTLTAYPQAGSGGANVTCDGYAFRYSVDETFSVIRAGAGTHVSNSGSLLYIGDLESSTTTNQFSGLIRTIATFDTSALTSDATISATTFSVKGAGKSSALGTDVSHIVSATPASNNILVVADYTQLGATSFANITHANFSTTLYNDYVLDANGMANVSLTGISRFGGRGGWDLNNSFTGTWASAVTGYVSGKSADTAGTTSDPKLVVTYTLPGGGGSTGSMFMVLD